MPKDSWFFFIQLFYDTKSLAILNCISILAPILRHTMFDFPKVFVH